MMGGKIWVESKGVLGGDYPPNWPIYSHPDSQGSTFYFTLKTKVSSFSAVTPYKPLTELLQGKKALIIGKNKINQQMLMFQCHKCQMETVVASSGKQALAILANHPLIDVAILEGQMSGTNGLSLPQQIQSVAGYHNLPLILVSSRGSIKQPSTLTAIKNLFIMTKPIKQSQLHQVLLKIFSAELDDQVISPITHSAPNFSNSAPNTQLKILIAEDNIINQKVIINILKHLGYCPDVVANGLEVLDILRRQSYDLILMDMQMPEMDGLTATRQIRTLWQTCHPDWRGKCPYIIAMTANVMAEDIQICLDAGMDDYLSKPLKVGVLIEKLNSISAEVGIAKPEKHQFSSALNLSQEIVNMSKLDQQIIAELREIIGEKDFPTVFQDLLQSYLEDSPNIINNLENARANQNLVEIKLNAHSLKSSSISLGATYLAAICQQLEQESNHGNLATVNNLIDQVINEYKNIQKIMELELNHLAS
jgi:CheY-like chemotaxis protein